MFIQALILFFATILQNGSFTLVSRARNSGSLKYNAFASVLSNGMYAIVMRFFVPNLDSTVFLCTYVAGAATGSVLMQWVAMRWLEKPRKPKPYESLTEDEVKRLKMLFEHSDLLRKNQLTEELGKLKEAVERGEN